MAVASITMPREVLRLVVLIMASEVFTIDVKEQLDLQKALWCGMI